MLKVHDIATRNPRTILARLQETHELLEPLTSTIKIDQDDLIHVLDRYSREVAAWVFRCGHPFAMDAHTKFETFEPVTCMQCLYHP